MQRENDENFDREKNYREVGNFIWTLKIREQLGKQNKLT